MVWREDRLVRALALLLLTAGLVAGTLVPGLGPALTDDGRAQAEGDDGEAAALGGPAEAVSLKGTSATPHDALSRVAADRDAPSPPPLPEVQGEDPLPDALRTLADARGTPLDTPARQAALDEAGRLPQDLQEELALVVLAVAEARDLQAEAVEDLTPQQRRALASGDLDPDQAREIRSQVDVGKSLQAARLVDAAVRQARPGLETWSEIADGPAAQTMGLAEPASPPTPAEQAPQILEATGTTEDPADLVRASASLSGAPAEAPPLPEALQEAGLEELLVLSYGLLDIPRTPGAAASVAALPALDPAVRELAADGLRHYVHALTLQRDALADLSPAERQALAEAGPELVSDGPAAQLTVSQAALVASGLEKIDRGRVHESALAMLQAQDAFAKQAQEVPADPPAEADCPEDTRDPSTQGVTPTRTDEPLTCTVGDLKVELGLTDETGFHLSVDREGDGNPPTEQSLQQGAAVRLHYDPDTLQVTVYEDADGGGDIDEDEIEFQNEPLRDRDNNVAFVSPYGYFVVGSEAGPTVYDDRYGDVEVPPDPRDDRVDATRDRVESENPFTIDLGISVRGLPACGGDRCHADTEQAYDDVWRIARDPIRFSVNPNGTHILTMDLGGDSTYTRNVGTPIQTLVGPYQQDENVTVGGFDTGYSQFGPFLPQGFPKTPAAAFDLGGDDAYVPDMDRPAGLDGNFTIGTSVFGQPGLVVDAAGDDTYRAENTSVGFGALAGLGLVADLGGDDAFTARNGSLGAATASASGLLLAAGGNDTFRGGWDTQGAATVGEAVGLLVASGDGEDRFVVTEEARFRRVQTGQGTFRIPTVAQGASAQSGIGLLVDGGGDDVYNITDRPEDVNVPHFQGASLGPTCASVICPALEGGTQPHVGLPGILADLGGDDTGLRITGAVEHTHLGEVRLGPHYTHEGPLREKATEGSRRAPTGYVLDADLEDPRAAADGPARDGYLFDPGTVTWDTREDPVSRDAFTLNVPGLLALGDTSDTNWTESHVVSIDLGGDDAYRNRPGAAVLAPEAALSTDASDGNTLVGGAEYQPRLVGLHVDLGGSDHYRAAEGPATPASRALGAGIGAVGLAYDLGAGGDAEDTYEGASRVLGFGEAGVGVFHDEAGDDTYRLQDRDTPSRGLGYGSLGGVGVFADPDGADRYQAGDLSAGAYEFAYESAGATTLSAAGDNDLAPGAGVFLDGAGQDTYEVPERTLGHVEVGDTLETGGDNPAPTAALFVDEGFATDTYPAVHADDGRGNNDFWNTTVLGQGFDNIDYYMHYQFVWAGDATAQRAISTLLSPSARIVDPAYPADGEADLETLRGETVVTVNASYGGNRSIVLNARSLAASPFQSGSSPSATVEDVLPEVDPCELVRSAGRECSTPDPTPGEIPGPQETGHMGVAYANVTYRSLQNAMMGPDEREDENRATTEEHDEATQRIPDTYLGLLNLRARYPDLATPIFVTCTAADQAGTSCEQSVTVPIFGDQTVDPRNQGEVVRDSQKDFLVWGNLFNGSDAPQRQVAPSLYGFLDGFGVTTHTQMLAEALASPVVVPDPVPEVGNTTVADAPNRYADATFDCGHDAVEATDLTFQGCASTGGTLPLNPGTSPQSSASTTSPPPEARTGVHSLLVTKALAAGLDADEPLDEPVDAAIEDLLEPPALQAADPAACSTDLVTVDPATRTVDADAYVACVIRDAFHDAVEDADAARDEGVDACREANGTGCEALPQVINPPQGGPFVRSVELVADGETVAHPLDPDGTQVQLLWNTSDLADDGRYRWEDGEHNLTAKVYYRDAQDRPNRVASGSAGPGDTADARDRTRDPYGFYPGTDRIKVATDNPPRVYEAHATDLNPAEADCDGNLTCALAYEATISEDADASATIRAVETVGGGGGATFSPDQGPTTRDGDPVDVTLAWNPDEANPPEDGRYQVELTLHEPGREDQEPVRHATPFHLTSEAPTTLAVPAASPDGYSGLDHVDVVRTDDGAPDRSVETPWRLPVEASLPGQDGPRSPVASFDLYRRVYNPLSGSLSDVDAAEPGCPGATVDRDNATWCRVADDAPGNATLMNLTTVTDGERTPLEDRRVYLVARATDAAGNREDRPFPDVGPDLRPGDDPEGQTFVDLTRPSSLILVSDLDRNGTRVEADLEISEGPVDDVTVLWDLAPNASAAGDDPKELPDGLVDLGDRSFTWDADALGVDPDHGDRLWLRARAADLADNVETGTSTLPRPIRFDYEGPRIEGDVEAEARAQSITFEWTTDEVTANATATLLADGPDPDTRSLEVERSERFHHAEARNLTSGEDHRLRITLEDAAGNRRVVTPDRTFSTDAVIDLEPLAPETGAVLSDDVTVAWRAHNVTGDRDVRYNLTLAPDAGNCTTPLGEVTIFEGEPVRREFTFDSTTVPSVRGAQVCLRANNTLNPDDPVEVRLPAADETFSIDNAPPRTNLTVEGLGAGDWVQGRARVVLEATDDTPGEITTRYTVDGSEAQVYDGPFPLEEDGVYEVTYWSTDENLGHVEEEQTTPVKVDGTPPTGNLTVDDDAGRTASRNVTLTINGTDAVSGVSDVVVRSPGGRHRALPGSILADGAVQIPWRVSDGDGRKEVQVVLVDEAGNQLRLRRTTILDTTPPEFRRLEARSVAYTEAAVEWSTDQPTTGQVLYKEEGAPGFQGRVDVDASGIDHDAVLRNLTPGTTYVAQVTAEDALGNAAAKVLTFTTEADGKPPGPVEEIETTVLPSGYVELDWSAAFDRVGISHYVVARGQDGDLAKVTESHRTTYLDAEAPPGETLTYRLQAVDVGGNPGPPSEPVTVTTDTAPELLRPGVSPERGTTEDTYTYEVVVRDRDGDDPESVQVHVDGEPRPMTPVAGDDVTGGILYALETDLAPASLSTGDHTYAFTASDGDQETRWPLADAEVGPVVLAADGDAGASALGAVQRAVPAPGLLAVLSAFGAALAASRRWSQ